MPLVCVHCRRTNPAEAAYCYHDGFVLPGHEGDRPLNAGTQPFPSEFVFPSGRRCRNFDEFALACSQEWSAAAELLRGGYLESFLAGIGRADLASVARLAAEYPDPQRGLDMLLDKLPTTVIEPAHLQVEPLFVNLGQLRVGESRRIDLAIANLGMRLLYGTVSVENTPWLALGDGQGTPLRSFNCEHEIVIPVQVLGKKLKASKSALEGRILVETNGGTAEATLRIEVPVKPFPSGVLAGCRTQRQLAEAAFKRYKEAAPLFESGEVAMWYADNGWTYPVVGPPATGLAALQQFFEACGLTQAPRVDLEPTELYLQGVSGDRLERTIQVKAQDRKPAFAYAVSDQPWLVPGRPILSGTTATIPLEIPCVPYGIDGSILAAKVTVTANGRRKFELPVRLEVSNAWNFTGPPPVAQLAGNGGDGAFLTFGEEALYQPRRRGSRPWLHVLAAAALGLALLLVLIYDLARRLSAAKGRSGVGGVPVVARTAVEGFREVGAFLR